jgi:5-methyltetrahydropteroyltriglutamate--homocysteine methyltransferase
VPQSPRKRSGKEEEPCSRPPSPAACQNPSGSPRTDKLWPAWKATGAELEKAKRDATLLWLKEQEDAGLDIVTDGEQSRQHFVHGFLESVEGIDFEHKVKMGIRNNRYDAMVPVVVGPLRLKGRVHQTEARIARAHTKKKLKITMPGPMTIVDTIADRHYGDKVKLAMVFAELLNREARALEKDGVDVIQFDEPAFNVYMSDVTKWGIKALERAVKGLTCTTCVHICYGYGIKANLDWKETLGGEWRQYEEIFPALAKSRIKQVSLECIHSKVPPQLIAAPQGQGRAGGRDRRGFRARRNAPGSGGDDQGRAQVRAEEPPLPLHQLRHGADVARHRDREAEGAAWPARRWREEKHRDAAKARAAHSRSMSAVRRSIRPPRSTSNMSCQSPGMWKSRPSAT